MSNGETKYFAVSANNIAWMLLIVILFSVSVSIFTIHKVSQANQYFTKHMIDFNNEISNIKIKHGRVEERVDWNEDQLVKFHDWKDKVYHEKALNIEFKKNGGK